MKHAYLLLILLLVAGCETLPPGEPPAGKLVNNASQNAPLTPAQIEQQLTNLLIAASFNDFPGQAITLNCDEVTATTALHAVRGASGLTGLARQNAAPLELKGRSFGHFWCFELAHQGKLVWRHRFAVLSNAATSSGVKNRN